MRGIDNHLAPEVETCTLLVSSHPDYQYCCQLSINHCVGGNWPGRRIHNDNYTSVCNIVNVGVAWGCMTTLQNHRPVTDYNGNNNYYYACIRTDCLIE